MKKERGQEGEKEPALPLLKTLEDILHNKIKQKKEKRHFPRTCSYIIILYRT